MVYQGHRYQGAADPKQQEQHLGALFRTGEALPQLACRC